MSCIGPTRNSQLVTYREVARRLGISEYKAMRTGEAALARLRRRLRPQAGKCAAVAALLAEKSYAAECRLLAMPHTNVYIEDPEG